MSQQPNASASATLAFLTVLQEPSGWLGGYLVTNGWGRPFEFRLTTAVQPNRVQAALYGPTLHEYLLADLIGKTLVEKTATKPDLIVTDAPNCPAPAVAGRDAGCCPQGDRTVHQTPYRLRSSACRGRVAATGAIRLRLRSGHVDSGPRGSGGRSGRAVRPHPRGDRRGPQDGGDQPCGLMTCLALPWRHACPHLSLSEKTGPVEFDELNIDPGVREARLLTDSPWVRSLGRLELSIATEGWKFPAPPVEYAPPATTARPTARGSAPGQTADAAGHRLTPAKPRIRPKPTADTVLFKDRLLYLLQPPLDGLFDGRQLEVPFEPFPYQLEGIAFLMPRHAALLADEMGLGKTAQAILALRLLFHQGLIRTALIVCPKPLVHNWARELKMWAPDVPFETFEGDTGHAGGLRGSSRTAR